MSGAISLKRGLYAATVGVHVVEIMHETSEYGDSGWFFYIDGERGDFPRDTKAEAVEYAQLNLDSMHAALACTAEECRS